MTELIFGNSPQMVQASLALVSTQVNGVLPVACKAWKFNITDLHSNIGDLVFVDEVDSWVGKSKNCLYYFECCTESIDAVMSMEQAFGRAKSDAQNPRAFSRLNNPNSCIYVGSSQSMLKRLKEHLGYGSGKTYALNLRHWAISLNLEVQFVCAKYADGIPYSVIQTLEDSLWDVKCPMFRRQGRK